MASEEFEEIEDPLDRLERNERSGRTAALFLVSSSAAVLALAAAIGVVTDVDRPSCPPGPELCASSARVELVVLPTLLALVLSVVALWQTYRRWKYHVRWRPWLFVSQIMWLGTTGYLLASSTRVFLHR